MCSVRRSNLGEQIIGFIVRLVRECIVDERGSGVEKGGVEIAVFGLIEGAKRSLNSPERGVNKEQRKMWLARGRDRWNERFDRLLQDGEGKGKVRVV